VRVVGWPGLATGNSLSPISCPAELGLFGYFFWMELIVFSIAGLSAIIRSFQKREIGGTDAPEQSAGVSPEESHTTKRPQAMRKPVWKAARCARRPNGCDVGPWPPARASFVGYLSAAFFLSRPYTVTFFLLAGFATALQAFTNGSRA